MTQIYKINHLEFNSSKSQFCLSHNDGIITYNTNNFKERYNSNNLGNIFLAKIVHELNIVIFVGSDNNELYNNRKIVIYDLINQKIIYSTPFQNKITSLKIVNKYVIIGFQTELKIFSLEKKDNLIPIKEISLPESELYEVWYKSFDLLSIVKIFLVYLFEDEICISSFIGNEWNLDKKIDIKSPTPKIQNFFYIDKLNQIFIPDEKASYIYGINTNNGKQKIRLYRGNNPGIITSMTLLNKNYIAINNLNIAIHIYDINEGSNKLNISNLFGSFIYGNYISSFMTINYYDLIIENEGEFYEYDFQKKGAILNSEEDGTELSIIAYNGNAYKLKINFFKKEYDIILKEKFAEYQINQNEEYNINDSEINIYSSYISKFDKGKKNGNKEKFIVYK